MHALKFDHIRVTQLHVQADTRSGALMMSTGWFSPTKQAAQTALSPGKPVLYSTGKQPLSPCKSGISHQSVSPLSVKRCLSGSQTQYSVGASLQSRQAGDSSQVYRRNDECIFSRDASTTAPSSESSQINPALAPSACLTAPASTSSTVPQTLRQEQHEPWLALSSASQRSSMVPGTADLQASNGSTFWQGPSTSVGTATSAASALADQIPSARDVLESPPEVERDDSCSREQQAGQTFQGSLRPLMSGRRVTRRFDVPLGLDWLTRVPDHVANLGSGRLDIIMGPMFAGKTTQLIKRVSNDRLPPEALNGCVYVSRDVTSSVVQAGITAMDLLVLPAMVSPVKPNRSSVVRLMQVQEVSKDGQIAVVVKSSKDARYGCHWVVTHDGRCMRCFTADTLQQFKEIMGPHYQKLQVGLVMAGATVLSQRHGQ